MSRLTGLDAYGELVVNEAEWLFGTKGYIDKDEMYKIMMHLAEKLQTYEDLEDDERLIKLPCKLGTKVYSVLFINDYGEVGDKTIRDYYIKEVNFDIYKLNDIGKTVFLTKEEAENYINHQELNVNNSKEWTELEPTKEWDGISL